MDNADIARIRRARQGLSAPRFADAEAVVQWLGAVQSQDYDISRWSLGQRQTGANEAVIEQAFAEGRVLRTHVLRPTWHFVAPADARWLLELTGPRIKQAMAYYEGRLELDDAIIGRAKDLIASAIAEKGPMTRNEVARVLQDGGIEAQGQRLAQIMIHAELDRVACSGPRRGKQHTYALFDQRAPASKSLPQDEALSALAIRYFASRGPATAKDFSAWSSLTVTEARRAIEMLSGSIGTAEADGRTYYWLGEAPEADASAPRAHLLQTYDEYVMGYLESRDILGQGSLFSSGRPTMANMLVVDGVVAGRWRRTLSGKNLRIDLQLERRLNASEHSALDEAIERLSGFVGLPSTIGDVEVAEA
jgi:hypothetical protein